MYLRLLDHVRLRKKGSNLLPLDHDSTFHATETPAIITEVTEISDISINQ